MHSDACGKAAREYFVSYYMSEIEEDAEIVDDAIDELLDTVNYSHLNEGVVHLLRSFFSLSIYVVLVIFLSQ